MGFIFVPSVAFNSRVKKAGVELAPETPTATSRALRSATELTGTACQSSTMAVSALGDPNQLNLTVVARLLGAEQRLDGVLF